MAAGLLLLASAGYDQYRGITHAPSGGGTRYSAFLSSSHEVLTKAGNPEYFHNAIVCHTARSFLVLLMGFILFMIDRGQDKVDPMAPDADEHIDEELRKDELDGEAMKKGTHQHPES
jgi:hypothetical protein